MLKDPKEAEPPQKFIYVGEPQSKNDWSGPVIPY